MTCRHVLGLIDAGPFADYPTSHLEAAWSHARACPTCGPALQRSGVMTDHLRTLAQPAAPTSVRSSVMARITRLEVPILDQAARSSSTTAVRSTRVGWNVWGSAACLTAGFVAIATLFSSAAIPWPGWGVRLPLKDLAASSPAALAALTCGLAVYAVGLLMPLRRWHS
jgi:hypothetical protein